jgi:hypothetical protein
LQARRFLIAVLFAALAVAALRDVARIGNGLPWRVTYDLPDFYCAGSVLNAGANPYLYGPLRACEHRVDRAPSFETNPSIAIPAPQPPYDFPAFRALAHWSYPEARTIYAIVLVLAVLLTAVVLGGLKVPLDVALLALVLSAGYHELEAGQIIPFVLLFLALAGWLLARGRDVFAGICAALTLAEPHLGAGVVLSVLAFVPRARLSVVATGLVLAFAALAVAGPSTLILYLTRVLSAQAAAEVRFPPQYSLTYALHTFGVTDSTALAIGALSFCVFLGIGIGLSPALARRLGRRELLVFFPAAATVMAGAYVHVVELAFAIPAALILATSAPGKWRSIAAVSLALLSIPWILAWSMKKLFLASAFVTAALFWRLRVAPAIGIAALVLTLGALYDLERHPPKLPTPPPLAASSYPPNALVQVEWAAVVRSLDIPDRLWLAIKLPQWSALAGLLLTAVAVVSRDRRGAPAA